jgi:hypothetical protein
LGKALAVKVGRGAEHGQACTKERTGAVAVRAALESAVQVGRGNEGNRQAEMANPTKCRDSLQTLCCASCAASCSAAVFRVKLHACSVTLTFPISSPALLIWYNVYRYICAYS